MEYRIRPYRPEDFDLLWRIDQACFPPGIAYSRRELLTYISRRASFTLVAEAASSSRGERDAGPGENSPQGPLGGFVVAETGRPRTGHIITIDVRAEARRSGLGSKLLTAAEGLLRHSGCQTVVLETAVDNQGALAFYKRHAYFLVKTIPRYYATGVDAFVLKKDLLPPVPAS